MKRAKQTRVAPKLRTAGPAATLAILGGLILLTVFTYWNSLSGEFVFDDQQVILQSPVMLNIHSLGDVTKLGMGWRQLLYASYGLNYFWSGVRPTSYHVVNLVLHVINVILVYFIILDIARKTASPALRDESRFAALTGAAVFAVHTLLSSAVSYISGRSSVLCAVFYFLGVFLFLKALAREKKRYIRVIYLVGTALSGVMAWQVKQDSITLPLVLAGLFWLLSEKKDLRYVIALAALPLIVGAIFWRQIEELLKSLSANQTLMNAGFEAVLPPATYIRTFITALVGYYFPRFLFPANLNADPHILPVSHWYSPEFLFSMLILGVLVWLVIRPRSTNPLVRVGIAGILVSPFAAYAFIPLADVVLEHRAYIPGLGIAILAAALFRWLPTQFRNVRLVAPVLTVIVLAGMTIQRNTVFANNVALWQDATKKSPDKARAHFDLGAAYQTAQRTNDAIREYEIALKLKPDIHAAYSNISAIQLDTGRLDEAEKTLVRLTEIAPNYTEGFINLAVLYVRRGNADKAIAMSDRAIALNPEAFAAHFNKGEALTLKGSYEAAVKSYERAMYLRPDLVSFRLNLGAAYVRAGDFEMAEKTYQELTSGPVAAEACRGLATMYDSLHQQDRAVDYLKKAIQLKSNYPDAHHDLGVIYLKRELLALAIEEFRTTLTQNPAYAPGVLNLSMAYQAKGDFAAARKVLETYLEQFGNMKSEYLPQVQSRLAALRQAS